MNQRAYESFGAGASQADAIISRLRAEPGRWIPMPLLVEISGSFNVHSRVADLRKRGCVIESRQRRNGRQVVSEYRVPGAGIEPEAAEAAERPAEEQGAEIHTESAEVAEPRRSLFEAWAESPKEQGVLL